MTYHNPSRLIHPDVTKARVACAYLTLLSQTLEQAVAAMNPLPHMSDNQLTAFVDARGLACPMPLLKTKLALRCTRRGHGCYVIATDPNSLPDIDAFCRQSLKTDEPFELQLTHTTFDLSASQTSHGHLDKHTQTFDTIFHLIITKTHGNPA